MTYPPALPVTDPARGRELLGQVLDRCLPGLHGHYEVEALARVLTSTGQHQQREQAVGGTTFGTGQTWGRLLATGGGVTIHHANARPPVAYHLPWGVVDDIAQTDPCALSELEAAREARRAHARLFPSVYPDLGVRKVSGGDIHPEDRGLYAERRQAYNAEMVDPWYARHDELGVHLRAATGAVLEPTQGFLDLDALGAPTVAQTPHPHPAAAGLSL